MTYCFKCNACGAAFQLSDREAPGCYECGEPLTRDWRAENVGIGSGVRESKREMTTSGYRDLFLPTADDFASTDDPSGQKGLRNWAETHGPKEGNTRPVYPEMERQVFPTS
jgi:predicted  nucleic acid-binding Zn-ribbon protein